MKFNQNNRYRIGAYVRVSSEEQAANPEGSIKNQEQRLRDYVKQRNADVVFGEIVEVFTDPGISAKDMNRPSLQRLLTKVRNREIDLVLVTELSRLTRSTKDFSLLWEFLNEHGCKFQSLRDNFDTTTPAGEMIIFTLANFAQFERKQTAERITNSFLARSKRGLWNGGCLPLGYEVDAEKPGHLRIIESEAEIVREVFSSFLKKETLSLTAKDLNTRGIQLPRKMRGGGAVRAGIFRIENTHQILRNKTYVGIKTYKTKDGMHETKAVWNKIIDPLEFDRVQKLLSKNRNRKKPASQNRYPYQLSGLLFCKACGDRMCGKSAHGKKEKIAYYEHAWSTKNQACLSKQTFNCEPNRILAKKIEPVVWIDLKRLLASESYAKLIFAEAKAKHADRNFSENEIGKLKSKISSINNQIEATTERITELPKGIDANSFYQQILKLQEHRLAFETQLDSLKADAQNQDEPIQFKDFKIFTEGLRALIEKCTDPEEQAAIIRKLVSRIDVTPDGIIIAYHAGEAHFVRELTPETQKPQNSIASALGNKKGLVNITKPSSKPLPKYRSRSPFVACSNTLTNGRGYRT